MSVTGSSSPLHSAVSIFDKRGWIFEIQQGGKVKMAILGGGRRRQKFCVSDIRGGEERRAARKRHAIEADKYDLSAALKYASARWLKPKGSEDKVDMGNLMAAAFLFGDMDTYSSAYPLLQRILLRTPG
ncbi:hypothetical protein K469DRAFT_683898 [Zopfia rhizophila CBS 207.26]|uniref:Uncharacterized protein n=1 Tax=Zopfia rhizophila CBS 207.26 TaxID=1314779 RepID=A0A6A6D8R8_9PEZI|nr:hypothetical protein K469DRAFT_683898 [Zopfia rhizophila CBS 207.26]